MGLCDSVFGFLHKRTVLLDGNDLVPEGRSSQLGDDGVACGDVEFDLWYFRHVPEVTVTDGLVHVTD